MDGRIVQPHVLLRGAHQAHARMMQRGAEEEAARLRAHLRLSVAAVELQRHKDMQHDELLDVIGVLEGAQMQVPAIIGVEMLRVASLRLPGSSAPDAADMLDMMWMWPMTPAAPAAKFHSRNPRLADLQMNMSDRSSAFKLCYIDNYLGAMFAVGPGQEIHVATDMFLARWEMWTASNKCIDVSCPGWEAAKGIAPRAQRHSHLSEHLPNRCVVCILHSKAQLLRTGSALHALHRSPLNLAHLFLHRWLSMLSHPV